MTSKETKKKKKQIKTVTLEELVKTGEKQEHENLNGKENPVLKKDK